MTSSRTLSILGVVVVVVVMVGVGAIHTNNNQTEAEEFLKMFNKEVLDVLHKYLELYWIFHTNITTENQEAAVQNAVLAKLWIQNMSHVAVEFNTTDFPPDMQRQLHEIGDIGTSALNSTQLEKLKTLKAEMASMYSTAKVCLDGKDDCLPLNPDITQRFQTSRDEGLLRRLWWGWRDASGKRMRHIFPQYVALSNEGVQILGYEDTGAYWRSWYETETFEQDVAALFEELLPFYRQLHAFARHRLKEQYGEEVFPSSGHIPAHLLGNMWAEHWQNILGILLPYPGKPKLDVTEELVRQNYTARKIYKVAEEFFTSLGLEPMTQTFWEKSMFEKPDDGREVFCYTTAWDFGDGEDFRVKQCTEINMEHFLTAHQETGYLEYAILYKDLPFILRGGASPGFHRAVGDTISLSVQTQTHMHRIGLHPVVDKDEETDLDFMMGVALQKIAAMPFDYLIDQWRWSVFRGDVTPANYNQAWWDLRCKLQGVSPPVKRTEEDFDPGAMSYVANNIAYIRYFVSFVIQFQFHEALCQTAGHQGPLHTCDIYNSTEAGDKLRAMMSKGASEVWTVPFEALTGQTKMSAQPLIQYFQPLMDYLEQYNKDHDVTVGWEEGCPWDEIPTAAGSTCPISLLLVLMSMVTVVF